MDSGRSLNEFRKQEWSRIGFFKEGPEWSRSRFLNMTLVCILLFIIIAGCFFTKYVVMSISNVKNYFTGSPKILIQLGCK